VVARADTPASVLSALHADGGGTPTSYGGALSTLADTSQARGDALALLVSLGVAVVASTHLAAWLAGQTGRRRAEVAGLRVAGFAPRAVRRAYRVEAMVLGLVVLVGSALTAIATTATLLRPMRLVGGWSAAPPVVLSLRPLVLVPSVVGTALVVALACLLVFTRFGRSARPSALRSADR
jgi:ABC-type lipoprotein release transport system permease subunit